MGKPIQLYIKQPTAVITRCAHTLSLTYTLTQSKSHTVTLTLLYTHTLTLLHTHSHFHNHTLALSHSHSYTLIHWPVAEFLESRPVDLQAVGRHVYSFKILA